MSKQSDLKYSHSVWQRWSTATDETDQKFKGEFNLSRNYLKEAADVALGDMIEAEIKNAAAQSDLELAAIKYAAAKSAAERAKAVLASAKATLGAARATPE